MEAIYAIYAIYAMWRSSQGMENWMRRNGTPTMGCPLPECLVGGNGKRDAQRDNEGRTHFTVRHGHTQFPGHKVGSQCIVGWAFYTRQRVN